MPRLFIAIAGDFRAIRARAAALFAHYYGWGGESEGPRITSGNAGAAFYQSVGRGSGEIATKNTAILSAPARVDSPSRLEQFDRITVRVFDLDLSTSVAPSQTGFSTTPQRGMGAVAINTAGNREEAVGFLINGATANKSASTNQVEFAPLALTRAKCPPGSLHDQIVKQWGYIRSYVIKDGHLFLSLMADGGIYEFEPLGKTK